MDRVDLLSKIREEILSHPHLEERLSLCQRSGDTPDWWQPGKHDKELLLGAAKHGLGRTESNILHDPDLSFHKMLNKVPFSTIQTPMNIETTDSKAIKIENRDDILKFDKDEILVKLEKGEGTLKIEKVGMKKDSNTVDKKVENSESEKSQIEFTIVKTENKSDEKNVGNGLTITSIAKAVSQDGEISPIKTENKEEIVDKSCKDDKDDEDKPQEIIETKETSSSSKENSCSNTENKIIANVEVLQNENEEEKQETEDKEISTDVETHEALDKEIITDSTVTESEESDKKVEGSTYVTEPTVSDSTDANTKTDNLTKADEPEKKQSNKSSETPITKEALSQTPCKMEDKCSVQAAELKAMFPDLEVIQPLSRLTQIDTFVLRDKTVDYNNEPTVVQLLAHSCNNATVKWPKVSMHN